MGVKLICAALLGLCLAACAGPGPRYTVEQADSHDAPAAAAAVSQVRQAQGLGPVTVDSRFNTAALSQVKAMAAHDTLSHTINGDFSSRMQAIGFTWGYSAENLGMGYTSVASAMRGWQASPGHRQNLLMPQATRIGFARARAAGKTYWALILASPDHDARRTAQALKRRFCRLKISYRLKTVRNRTLSDPHAASRFPAQQQILHLSVPETQIGSEHV